MGVGLLGGGTLCVGAMVGGAATAWTVMVPVILEPWNEHWNV